mmetsp:Transcript_30647/g.34262  ORF Transcript_30647/g.34262 Transcript_30647/m.34262 type:complete len:99 (-) Transcript_30647:207-503(-)
MLLLRLLRLPLPSLHFFFYCFFSPSSPLFAKHCRCFYWNSFPFMIGPGSDSDTSPSPILLFFSFLISYFSFPTPSTVTITDHCNYSNYNTCYSAVRGN